MYGSNALPLPPPFTREHRSLQLPPEPPRPLPTGECRYAIPTLHTSSQSQTCACQSFHLNRSAQGSVCECGHHTCYHVPESNEKQPSPSVETINAIVDKLNTLSDKFKRMEENILAESRSRELALERERHMWEREVRILREALAPFYTQEKDMRRKMTEIEDRLEGNYDEQVRLRDRVMIIDDATMSIDKRVEELEGSRPKRRRVARPRGPEESNQHGHVSPDSSINRVPSSIDERSVHTPSSRALSPNVVNTITPDTEEPRSSGILNLVELPRINSTQVTQHLSPSREEARSSGFLTLDLTSSVSQKLVERSHEAVRQSALTPPQDRPSPPGYATPDPEPLRPTHTPPEMEPMYKGATFEFMEPPPDRSPRKRKHPFEHMALDVLADVSVASPLIH